MFTARDRLTSARHGENMARKALVIGIDRHPIFGHLETAGTDAAHVAAALREYGDFHAIPGPARTSLATVNEVILTYLHQLEAGDLGLLYFAGHALEVRGEGFLLASEANGDGAMGGISLRFEVYNRAKPGGSGAKRGSRTGTIRALRMTDRERERGGA